MITPSFGLTATERVLPSMALDFTTGFLDSRITFTRSGGTATVINSSGNVASAGVDVPRFDYDYANSEYKGLLIEESRTNSALYSEDFTNAAWTTYATTASVIGNATTSPDGNTTADKLVADNGAALLTSQIQQRSITVTADKCPLSIFAKAGEFDQVMIRGSNYYTGSPNAVFDLSTGLVASTNNASAEMMELANGWYRCTVIPNSNCVAGNNGYFSISARDSVETVGDGSSGVYIWGAQLEASADFATSYIPTTTAALTRNADVATMTGTNFSDWYNASEGAMEFSYAMVGVKSTASQRLVQLDDGTETSRIANFITSSNSLQTTIVIPVGNPGSFNPPAVVITPNTIYTQAFAYKQNNCQSALNGVSREPPDTEVDIPTVTTWRVASSAAGVVSSNLWLRTLYYWPQRLLSAELAAFTK